MLSNKELKVLIAFLEELGLHQGNQVCNDWSFPEDWTHEEKVAFVKEFHEYNGDPEEFNEKYLHLHDYAVVAVLAHKLTKLLKE